MTLIRRWRVAAVLLGVPMALLVMLRAWPSIDVMFFSPDGHLAVVTAIAVCAFAVAVVAVLTAQRHPQPGIVLLGLGCTAVGIFMVGHGLCTPGALGQPANRWVGRLPYLALCIFAMCLFVAGLRVDRALNRWVSRHPLRTVVVPAIVMALLCVAVCLDPWRLHGATPFAHENTVLTAMSAVTVSLLVVVIWRHGRRWQLGHDEMQLAVLLAATMTIAAVFALEHGRFTRLSWWDYHAYLLAGFGSAVHAVLLRGRRQRTITDVLTKTFVDDPFSHIVQGYPTALSELVRAVEIKDTYTHGHSQRTAELAVELGLRMGLAPERLRVIARGAYLHDLGKIAIPDHILNKPGKLTAEERAIVETHPQLGYELAASAPSLREVLPVILHHHERVDGHGYPAGLIGNAVPLEARVVAVADVWDALTSDRAYRRGWEPSQALAHIDAGRGTHFDCCVVDAMIEVAAERGFRVDRAPGEAEQAWQAAQTCHEIDPSQLATSASR